MREFGKIITRKTDLTDAQVQEKYKFPAIIILHDNEDHIVKITHYQKNGTKTIYDFSLSASKQFVTDSIATAIAGLQDNRLEFNAFSDFPAIGDETKFYIDLSEDKIYIWDSNSQTYKNQSWDTATMGSRSQQLSLSSVFRINQDGNANKIDVRAGQLYSQTLDKTWNVSALVSTISDNDYRYVYAKASKTTSTATIYLSKNQILFDSDVNDYYFLVGILHSVVDGVRVLSITIGTTTISGGLVRTGIISSLDGLTSFNLNTGEIKGKITFSSGSSGYENLTDKPDLSSFEQTRDYVNSTLQTDLTDLKNRADGVIESWFYSHTPMLSNLPASNWVTTEERNAHIGDTFTNMQEFVDNATTPDAGKAWRFVKNETTGEFSWSLIANSDSTKALIEAGKAKDTADAKRRVFVSQPYPPYNVGDLWVQGNGGDIMRCKFERLSGSYIATDFEKASKYTDDTAVNNLQIGGRNMLRDSKQPNFNLYDQTIGIIQKLSKAQYPELENEVTYIRVTGGTSAFINLRALLSIDVPKAGELVSLSFKVKNFLDPITLASNQGGRETEINVNNQTTLVKWEGIVGDSYGVVQIQVRALTTNLELYVWDVMYEKGNKATDWTPAPEDVVADYTALINQEIADVEGKITGLETTVNTTFKDGIIQEAEAKAIEKYINSLNAEKADIDNQYNTINGDALLTGTAKTNLESQKSSYDTAHSQLISTINTAISDGKTTAAEKQDVDTKFTNYRNVLGGLSIRLTEALKAIDTARVANIKLGGRNYARNGNYKDTSFIATVLNINTITAQNNELRVTGGNSGYWYHNGFHSMPLTETITISFWVKNNASAQNTILTTLNGNSSFGNIILAPNQGWTKYEKTGVIGSATSNPLSSILFENYNSGSFDISIKELMVEKGNKASDYTEAPEDVEAKISAEAQKVIILENKTDFLTGTTIEGNAVATGTLLVGNSEGTNAGLTGIGSTTDGVYLWGGGTYQQMVQGLAKKEQRRNGIDIWRHPNGQIGFEIGIKDGRLIFNGYHESGFKLFELDPNRGLVNVSYTQESWTETPFRKLTYSSSTFNESTIASEIQGFLIKQSQQNYLSPPPYNTDSEFVYTTTYSVTQNAVGYDYDNGTNPANASYESLKGMKANYNDRNNNITNGWYMSSIGEIHMESEWNSYPPPTYTFTVYVYYYQDGKITQTKVVTVTK